ncbi:hypothetical protein [Actinoplanes xinjiangensis]|uniref:hypothetical protein n=1 Tax=Actinoplanes xinjiangensis TaxID=512350 RepID=UPI003422A74C
MARRGRLSDSRYRLSYLYAAIGALLLVAAFALLYPVRHTTGFADELRIGIGANLIDLTLAVLVLQPLVLYLSRNAVRRRNRLDYRAVIGRIETADDRVDLWKHWTGLLEGPHEARFTETVRGALDRGVRFRIMLTDPSSPDAAERARQVAPTDAITAIRQNIERLDRFVADLPARHRPGFQVRISATGPAHAFYRVDDWLTYGIFRDRRVSESSQREVRVRGDLGELALEAFENRWNGVGLRNLTDHYRMRLRVTVHDDPFEYELRYVVHDGEHWVNVNPSALPHAFHPDHRVTAPDDGTTHWTLVPATPETLDRVTALYTAKYGPGEGPVLLRLAAPDPSRITPASPPPGDEP